jgi:hypothetical protein
MTTQQLHETIKAKLAARSTDELISDAKVARANKEDEAQRMIFALTMDVIHSRVPQSMFEDIYREVAP